MLRSFTYVLRPLAAQRAELHRWREQCCELYNAALEQRRDTWRKQRKSISYAGQCRDLTSLRKEPEFKSVPAWVQRSPLRRVDLAFAAFYRRCKAGQTPGYPRFKSRARYSSFDLGLKEFAVLSGGEAIANPRHFKRGADSLARAQRVLARKQRGSNSRLRARRAVGRAHARIANQRLDFHRKLAKQLCARFDLIAHEALNVRGLARGILSKSVHDAGWGSFLRTLHSKAEEAGVHVVAVDPRHTTQTCSACGTLVPKGLGDRVHTCKCGLVLDRDHNAAINILARGLRASPAATSDRAL